VQLNIGPVWCQLDEYNHIFSSGNFLEITLLRIIMSEEPHTNGTSNGASNGTPNGAPFKIPIVDFSPWRTNDNAARLKVAKEIVNASRDVGFVYIVNHGVSEPMLDEAFEWTARLFALPHEDKMKAPHPKGWAVHRGYSWPGLEKVSHVKSAGNDDDEEVKKLRAITDCKVSSSLYFWNILFATSIPPTGCA
jgi:hypothetical protein